MVAIAAVESLETRGVELATTFESCDEITATCVVVSTRTLAACIALNTGALVVEAMRVEGVSAAVGEPTA